MYLGEDVEHGGYYLVTDQLSRKFPGRVRDLPPDETSLVGIAHGLAQAGLLVVCEVTFFSSGAQPFLSTCFHLPRCCYPHA